MTLRRRKLSDRVQTLVDEMLHLLQHESMSGWENQSPRLVQASRLENRILMSASPMVMVAEAVSSETPLLDASSASHEVLSAEPENQSNECVDVSSQADLTNSECDSTLWANEASQQAAVKPGPELIVIDYRVQDADTLLEGLLSTDRDFRLLRLAADENGVSVITAKLEQIGNVSAVHLLTHGREGEILLGSARLNANTLTQYAPELLAWQHSLTSDADLLLYGCDVAGTVEGQDFVESLRILTGADVAASSNATGSSTYGGDWILEFQAGAITTQAFYSSTGPDAWEGLLGVITVTTTNDVVDGDTSSVAALLGNSGADGLISLREAIIATNNSAGADTIFLSAGTYTITIGGRSEDMAGAGDLDIRDSLTIIGAGSGLSIIDANALDRVFHVQSGISAEISDVTIRGGATSVNGWGGGILVDNGAILNLSRVVVTGNTSGSGAGIYNHGTLVATDTVISNNMANQWGGGLYNDRGNVTLNRGTISGNSAGKDGGGILNTGSGASMSLTNVTLSGNTALEKGGGIWTSRVMTVTNSTIAFNDALEGDGVFTRGGGGSVALKNSVLYNPGGVNANRGLTSLGYNIDSDGTAALAGFGDLVADPLLAPLANYGGLTPTHALLAASPAINAGTADGAPLTDQRSASRLGAVDIGAYEYTVIGYEPFNYSAGSFNGANGGSGWATGWSNVGASTTIAATGLNDPSAVMPVSGGTSQLAIASDFGTVTQTRNLATSIGSVGTTTWLSFLLSPDSTVLGNYMGVQFGSSSGTSAFAGYYGNVFVLGEAGNSVIVSGITPSSGQTYLLTVKMEFLDGADVITLYVNPTSGLAEPNSPFTTSINNLDLGVFTEIGLSGGRLLFNNDAKIDELRIGSSFPDVAPAHAPFVNSAPVITSHGGGPSAAISVPENTTHVTTVIATDADLPAQTLTYSISGGTDAAWFLIDSSSGVLRFFSPPDAESPADNGGDNVYEVIVRVSDGALTDSQEISVIVTDVNEFSVGAVSDINAVQNAVAENSANGTTVGITARAIDPDISNNTVTYSLDDSAEGRFAISAVTGVVTVADGTRLDRESAASHTITIRATSSDTSSSTQTFTISVLPVNDNSPVIISNGGGATAAISVPENTTHVTTVIATDADLPAQTLTYSISGGADAAWFMIDSSTGVLRFISPPDAESPADNGGDNVYEVIVRVSDGTLTDSQEISVIVTDVNEFSVGAVSDINAVQNAVAENSANGTTVGITARAIDPDISNNTVTYSLDNSAEGRFAIHSVTGVVTVADGTRLDRESAASHTITIRATSSDASSSTQTFTISVLPVNDNSPVIISNGGGATAAISVPENTTHVTTVIATDADLPAQTLTYSISGGTDAARFVIDSSTGVLRFASVPNFESPIDRNRDNIYHVAVQASDGAWTDTQVLTVTVIDVNEAPTVTGRAFQTTTDQPLIVSAPGLLATAFDPDGDTLHVIILQSPVYGTFVSQSDGTFRYDPVSGYSGRDNFLFAVSDGTHVSQAAFASIDVLNAPAIPSSSQVGETTGSASPTDSVSSTTIVTSATPLTSDGTVGRADPSIFLSAANAKPGNPASSSDQESTELPAVFIMPDLADRSIARVTQLAVDVRRDVLYQQLSQDGQVWQQMDSFHEQLSESAQIDAVVVGSVGVVGTGLSVGDLIWMVRFGTVLSGLLAQIPAWTMLDPLLVVDGQGEEEDQESIQTIVDQKPLRQAGVRTASTEPTGNDHSVTHRDKSSDRC